MNCESGFGEHGSRISANQHGFAGDELVMIVQHVRVRAMSDRSKISRDLPKILASVFQGLYFERANSEGIKPRHSDLGFHHFIIDGNRPSSDNSVIENAQGVEQTAKIFDVHGTREAFAQQDLIFTPIY